MPQVRIAAAQTPDFRDDVDAALASLIGFAERAGAAGARLVCFPEGFLQGYVTAGDEARRVALDLRAPAFAAILGRLAGLEPVIVVGLIEVEDGILHNTAVVIARGERVGRYRKRYLLDGERCFAAGTDCPVFEVAGLRFGINICHDTNFPDAAARVAAGGAELIVCCANNMMPRARAELYRDRHNEARGQRCRETGLWLVSSDVTGARGDRVGWGPTAVLRPDGTVAAQLPLDAPGLLLFDLPCGTGPGRGASPGRA